MTRWLLTAALACGGFVGAVAPTPASAQSAPASVSAPAATEAQVDALFEALEMRRTLDEIFAQMNTMSETVGLQVLGEDATAEQRASMKRIVAQQQKAMREVMSWETMAPIYRRIYMRLFTADEVKAMTAFYGSDTGRGIMRKMPQAIQLSMEEMGPVMERMMAELRKNLETEFQKRENAETAPAH